MRRSDYQGRPSSTVSRNFLGNDRRVNPSVMIIDHSYWLIKLLHGYIGPSRGLLDQPVINDSANCDGEHTNPKRPKATAIFYFLFAGRQGFFSAHTEKCGRGMDSHFRGNDKESICCCVIPAKAGIYKLPEFDYSTVLSMSVFLLYFSSPFPVIFDPGETILSQRTGIVAGLVQS